MCLAFLASTFVSSLSEFSQKLWLSEYGYNIETSEEYQRVSFPVPKNVSSFNNSFVSKTGNKVVVYGDLSYIVFNCEANFPISWFVNQEVKTLSNTLKTRIYEFQGSTNASQEAQTYYKSLIFIHLDKSEYEYDTEEYFAAIYPRKWKLYCQKINANAEYCGHPSIDLIFEKSWTTEVSKPDFTELEEKITIAVMAKENSTLSNSSVFNLNYVTRHHPNFYANEDQEFTLGNNFTVNVAEFEDNVLENTVLVEYEHSEKISEGDLMQILCFSSKKIYSYGAQVQILWKNGTEIKIQEEIYDLYTRPLISLSANSKYLGNLSLEDDTSAEEDMLYFLSKEVQVELGMKQINCYMPVWFMGKWIKKSMEISVVAK